MAQILLAHENGVPIDRIVTADIYFKKNADEQILTYDDKLIEFRNYADLKIFELTGVKVEHISADFGFYDYFYRKKNKGNHIGYCYGFPFTCGAWCVDRLKVKVLSKFANSIKGADCTEFVGIAFDEPTRYERLGKGKRSLLFEMGVDEMQCMAICKRYDLLSPTYVTSFRDGCWFCPKQSLHQLWLLWQNEPRKWKILEEMQKDSFNSFKPNATVQQIRERFESGYIPKQKSRNKQTDLFYEIDKLME
ncbi:MAG: hypothetical protein R3Y18_00070 [Bacillota bacterium]